MELAVGPCASIQVVAKHYIEVGGIHIAVEICVARYTRRVNHGLPVDLQDSALGGRELKEVSSCLVGG